MIPVVYYTISVFGLPEFKICNSFAALTRKRTGNLNWVFTPKKNEFPRFRHEKSADRFPRKSPVLNPFNRIAMERG
jgi:hypothetical protein